jgi:hypothetical protein
MEKVSREQLIGPAVTEIRKDVRAGQARSRLVPKTKDSFTNPDLGDCHVYNSHPQCFSC